MSIYELLNKIQLMVKRKFKDIEKDNGRKECPPPRRSKKQKKEEHEDSGRTVTLTKKRTASRYNKASIGKTVSIKNAIKEEEEEEERIL